MAIFGNNKQEQEEAALTQTNNMISKGTTLTGDLEAFGNIRLEGKMVGNLTSKSKVILGQTAELEGNVYAKNAELEGSVRGTLEITETLTLKSTAVVHGDIIYGKLVVEAGAALNGTCKMVEQASNGKAPKKQLNGKSTHKEALPA